MQEPTLDSLPKLCQVPRDKLNDIARRKSGISCNVQDLKTRDLPIASTG